MTQQQRTEAQRQRRMLRTIREGSRVRGTNLASAGRHGRLEGLVHEANRRVVQLRTPPEGDAA